MSRYYNVTTEETTWEPCQVLDFEDEKQAYKIMWAASGKQKYLIDVIV